MKHFYLISLFWICALTAAKGQVERHTQYREVVTVQSNEIDENSGIAFSFRHPDAVWTHNDSGGEPVLYLVSLKSGQTIATIRVKNCLNRDWEDITTFQRDGISYIAVADVGDNARRRSEYQICIMEEPAELSDKVSTDWIDLRFRYEDGPRNCESIGYDPTRDQFVLIDKVYLEEKGKTGVYLLNRKPKGKASKGEIARRIGEIESKNFSALDISPDGSLLIARAYHIGYLFQRNSGETWRDVFARPLPSPYLLPLQKQGEGVCFFPGSNGKTILLSTEKRKQSLLKFELGN